MKQIRHGVFETNSSSTHSICISKKDVGSVEGHTIHFSLGEYGWESDTEYNTGDYLYTAIACCDDEKFENRINKLKLILSAHKVISSFDEVVWTDYSSGRYADNASIDHTEDLDEFIDDLLSDENKLLRYLFGDSCIYTGNDNSNYGTDLCYSAEETIWDGNKSVPNPNHNKKLYDYYFKGN